MTLYMVLRVCEKHSVNRDFGPPIGIYFSPELAAIRIEEWYQRNPWDKTTYTIKAMEVQGDPLDFDESIYVIIKVCEESYNYGSDCGPPVGLFYSEDAAIGNVRTFKRENPTNNTMFMLKNMEIRGERRKSSWNCFFGKLHRYTDSKEN